MKLVIRVTLQSQVSSNGQMVQRGVVHSEYNLPDGETLTAAYLDVGVKNEDVVLELIRK